jgi:dienelactone hydrolase
MKAFFLTLLTLSVAIQLQAGLITKPVMYEHNGAKLTGYLAYDDSVTAKGKAPGVLVFHEWWGLNDYIKGRADQLAKMGYVVFAADMYGDGQSTTSKGAFVSVLRQFTYA